jgi:outer membrane scaffolding protein for murein synthesis (MipA/OmpV family)
MPEKYGNYYYGVGSDETNLYTYYYNVGNSINWFTGINFIYLHSKKVSFICNIIYKFYDKNIYKSPIIHNKNRLTLISGINIKL